MHDNGRKRAVIDYVGPQVDCSRFPIKRAAKLTEWASTCSICPRITETSFAHLPAYVGAVGRQPGQSSPLTIGMLLQLVPNEGDAWSFALDNLGNSRSHALTLKGKLDALPELPAAVLAIDPEALPPVVRAFIGPAFPDLMSPLGRGTGELHLALRSLSQSPEVTPEPFSLLYQKIQTQKIRTHGDYHLGQVLYTGKDFVIIDFESEPVRSLTERRLKQSALRDVAAMIRSFHYAARGSLLARAEKQSMDLDYPRQWADPWYFYVSGTFLQA